MKFGDWISWAWRACCLVSTRFTEPWVTVYPQELNPFSQILGLFDLDFFTPLSRPKFIKDAVLRLILLHWLLFFHLLKFSTIFPPPIPAYLKHSRGFLSRTLPDPDNRWYSQNNDHDPYHQSARARSQLCTPHSQFPHIPQFHPLHTHPSYPSHSQASTPNSYAGIQFKSVVIVARDHSYGSFCSFYPTEAIEQWRMLRMARFQCAGSRRCIYLRCSSYSSIAPARVATPAPMLCPAMIRE